MTKRSELGELATDWQGAGHVAEAAAAVALIIPVTPDERRAAAGQYDLGQATSSMMIAAADLGVGSCHSRGRRPGCAARGYCCASPRTERCAAAPDLVRLPAGPAAGPGSRAQAGPAAVCRDGAPRALVGKTGIMTDLAWTSPRNLVALEHGLCVVSDAAPGQQHHRFLGGERRGARSPGDRAAGGRPGRPGRQPQAGQPAGPPAGDHRRRGPTGDWACRRGDGPSW